MNASTVLSLTGLAFAALCLLAPGASQGENAHYTLEVLPAEHKTITDPQTGTELIFLTTDPAKDTNLYFHERSWLADSSMILFYSDRANGGAMGYIVATGELARLATDSGSIGGITAAGNRNSVFGARGNDVLEWALTVDISPDPDSAPSKVTATERRICSLQGMELNTALSESCDGMFLSLGVTHTGDPSGPGIVIIETQSGEVRDLCRVVPPIAYHGHVQWSRTNPHLLSFAGGPERIRVVDIREGVPRRPYKEREGELVTHESWWGDDQILFCGGLHPKPTEDSHVKVLNIYTGQVRIIGAGSWWPGGTPVEIAKRNWWHAAGSHDGRWAAADNWHGDIALFEGKTTRERMLTMGHRTYGGGEHPHVGWDRKGEQVVFTSHMLGTVDVCVATIPKTWQEDIP